MSALALALSSSLCWGVADFIGGLQSRRSPLLVVLLVSQLVGLAGLGALIALRGSAPPELARLVPAAAAGIAGLAGLAALYRALALGTMSIVAPIAATGVAVPVVVGVAGGDRPAALQLAGLVAAVLGVVLASREPADAEAARAARASVGLAMVAALGFGSFFVGLRVSARADVPWALFASRASAVACLLVITGMLYRGRAGRGPLALGWLALMGGLDLMANGLYALASRRGLLSVVAVAASLYPLATVALARWLLGERVRPIQGVGIGTAIAGVVMLAAG